MKETKDNLVLLNPKIEIIEEDNTDNSFETKSKFSIIDLGNNKIRVKLKFANKKSCC